MHSAIYEGWVRHRRFIPRGHEFRYRSTLFYLDLDEVGQLFDGIFGWSYKRWNLGWFRREDYLDPNIPDLGTAVRSEITRQMGSCPDGPIRMLTNLRLWGLCFNPVTLYYVFARESDRPSVILAQVNNTPWDERHCYVIPCNPATGKSRLGFAKAFHVSPFNPMDMHYRWVSTAPSEQLLVHMENYQDGDRHMDATLSLERKEWSPASLRRILWLQPWLTAKIPAAIYWQALKLWLKRVPLHSHQTAPESKASVTRIMPAPDRR